jgi:hypothetical protein
MKKKTLLTSAMEKCQISIKILRESPNWENLGYRKGEEGREGGGEGRGRKEGSWGGRKEEDGGEEEDEEEGHKTTPRVP